MKNILIILFSLLSISLFSQTANDTIFWGDWEDGVITSTTNTSHNWRYVERMAADRYSIIDGGARQGRYYARCEVRSGDNPIYPTGVGTERCEVYGLRDENNLPIYETEASGTVLYSFSIKLDAAWQVIQQTSAGRWGIFFQVHPPSSITGSNPNFAISATDSIRVALRGGNPDVNPRIYHSLSDGALNIGTWADWIVIIDWKKDSTGYVIVKRRDEGESLYTEVLNVQNIPTLQFRPSVNGGAVGNHYSKFGLYRNDQTFTSVFYNDGFIRAKLIESADSVQLIANDDIIVRSREADVNADLIFSETEILQRGVCYSTSENPTTDNSKITNGSGLGSFTTTITGLFPSTTYYVRAYGINEAGTAYSNQVTFTTSYSSILKYNGKILKHSGSLLKY